MRVVFTTWAWPSHLYAMVPVAWACRASGHDVLVASQPELTEAILRTGLPAASVGRDVDVAPAFREILLGPGRQKGGPRVLGLLADLAAAMVGDLAALTGDWGADLLVFEPTAFAGPLAAAVLGIPAVRHLYGTDLMSAAGAFLPGVLGPVGETLGLHAVNPFGLATIDPCPQALQVAVGSFRLPVRYVPHNGPGVVPPRLAGRAGRPRVCVTWGTTLSRLNPRLFLAGEVVRAIAGLDLDVVVAITPAQRALLGQLPTRTHVVESAPLHLLLQGCDLVVAHGGAGTTLTALASGLPLLLIPRLPDHVRHAAQVARAGAGAVVAAPVADPGVIRDQVADLLATRAYRAAAHQLRREMRLQPPPAQVVRELERCAIGAATPV
jgi:UDP:flavonoid glycosyltransferase YjiC (YdhE family)